MLVLRSLLFNVAFYAITILWLIGLIPFVLLAAQGLPARRARPGGGPRSGSCASSPARGSSSAASSSIPPGGLLVASKHQSMLETFALVTIFDDPTFVLKRELRWIPFFGWYTVKAAHGAGRPQRRRGGAVPT